MAATPKADPVLPVMVEVLAEVDGSVGPLTIVHKEAELERISGMEAGLRRDAAGIITALARRGYVIVRADDGK